MLHNARAVPKNNLREDVQHGQERAQIDDAANLAGLTRAGLRDVDLVDSRKDVRIMGA